MSYVRNIWIPNELPLSLETSCSTLKGDSLEDSFVFTFTFTFSWTWFKISFSQYNQFTETHRRVEDFACRQTYWSFITETRLDDSPLDREVLILSEAFNKDVASIGPLDLLVRYVSTQLVFTTESFSLVRTSAQFNQLTLIGYVFSCPSCAFQKRPSARLLRECTDLISYSLRLCGIFNLSIVTGVFPRLRPGERADMNNHLYAYLSF